MRVLAATCLRRAAQRSGQLAALVAARPKLQRSASPAVSVPRLLSPAALKRIVRTQGNQQALPIPE